MVTQPKTKVDNCFILRDIMIRDKGRFLHHMVGKVSNLFFNYGKEKIIAMINEAVGKELVNKLILR